MDRVVGISILLLAMASGALAAKQGLPEFVVPDCLGVNIHFTGREDKQVEQIAKAGFRFIRMDFQWGAIETKQGVYDFKAYDELVDSLARRGIRPIFILDYGNALYDDGMAPRTDEGRRAFAAFAAAGATHFKGRGILWEIWNEPNLSQFWKPEPSCENYVKLAEVTSKAMKQADPGCTILAPALAGYDSSFMRGICELGLLKHIDVVSLHPYGSPKPEDAAGYYATMRGIIAEHAPKGKHIPLVSGEWGYAAVGGLTVERQGEYIAREFLSNMMNDVRLSIWYDWHDDGPDPNYNEHHFGTVYLDFKEKPAYFAMQTLSRELAGYTFAARMPVESDQDYLALFRKGDDLRLAAWTTGEPHKISLPVDVAEFELVSLTGERRQAKAVNGSLDLELTGAVTYVEPLKRSRRWAMEAGWKITAKSVWSNGRLEARIVSLSEGSNPKLSFSGPGVLAQVSTAKTGPKPSKPTELTSHGRYVWDGDPNPRITASLTVDGLDRPLTRVMEMDTWECPRVEVLPPMRGAIVVEVKGPASGETLKGRVLLEGVDGIALGSGQTDVSVRPGKIADVSFPIKRQPEGQFSLGCRLTNEAGEDIVRIPRRRYAVVETFADGQPGETVKKYSCELDGDAKVNAKASLTYASCPGGRPNDVCAKLDYEFDQGWRFVRIASRPFVPIDGKPRAVKIWIKGDGGEGAARLRVTDSEKQTFQPDYGRLKSTDWHCLTAPMIGDGAGHWGGANDGITRYPISWDSIFLLDNVGGRKKSGTVYLGGVMLVYD